MKNTDWKNVIELLGIVAIVGSLIFVGLELQQTQQIAMNESNWSSQISRVETRNAVNEHAEIWIKGNAGEELHRVEAEIYKNLIRSTNSHAFFTWITQQRLGQTGNIAAHDLAGFLFEYPAARRVWEEHRADLSKYRGHLTSDQYVSEFEALVRADLESLSETFNRSDSAY